MFDAVDAGSNSRPVIVRLLRQSLASCVRPPAKEPLARNGYRKICPTAVATYSALSGPTVNDVAPGTSPTLVLVKLIGATGVPVSPVVKE